MKRLAKRCWCSTDYGIVCVWVICDERQKTKDTTWCTQAFPTDTKNVIGLSYGIGGRDLWSERTGVTGWRRVEET